MQCFGTSRTHKIKGSPPLSVNSGRSSQLLCCMWIAIGSVIPLQAQRAVEGQVIDPSGAGIAGAQITAKCAGRTLDTASAGLNGRFSVALIPGACSLTIAADGFTDAQRVFNSTEIPGTPVVIMLQVAPQSQTLTVTDKASYQIAATTSATKTPTPLINIPQSVSVVTQELIRDQMMMSIGDVVRYVPGITAIQGENNRDQVVIRGNSSSADFFVNGFRDDVQYFRDLYNLERVEALKGSNAMMFGRGGGGGVINRVTKEAGFTPFREIALQGGSFDNKRLTADFDHPFTNKVAFRLNGMYDNSGSFRKFVGLERYAVNPTLTLLATEQTKIILSYENFHDSRTADRGIPSFDGRPVDVPISTFYGDPENSRVRAGVNLGSAVIEHQLGRLNIRNRTFVGDYDRYYQNYVPGAVNADKTLVALSAYNNATTRRNTFNQTDLTLAVAAGATRHTLLWGAEVGRQDTSNFRNTGFFSDAATSIQVPYSDTVTRAPIAFRQSTTDANNQIKTNLLATYIQDQVELSKHVQVVAGIRFDHFDLKFFNIRSRESLRRIDNLISPRLGVIVKPIAPMSVYVNYSVSWLPSAGDQFSSLTTITQQVKPEKFSNYEAGIKWDIRRDLSLTTAFYRLNRTNTRTIDPNDPTRIIQTGSQRTNGYELGLNGSLAGKWRVAGGYAYQDAFISSATASARAGAQVAQVPHHTFSLWNSYQFLSRMSAGLGILNRSDMYAGIDNTVTLPGYTRADAAIYYSLTEAVRLQANVENILDRRYYVNADSNTNISPGFPRAVRVGIIARF